MYRFYKKSPLYFSLAWILAYVVLFSAADSLSASLGMEKLITAPVGILLTGVLFGFLKKHDLLEEYGLRGFKGKAGDYLYFLPLAVIASTNLWNGVMMKLSVPETALFILSMVCVGFLEEVIFRGLLFQAIRKDNVKTAILISSLTFGFGHIVNLLNGAEVLPTLLQICYATAIGFLFVVIFYRGKSLIPCIVTHGVVNSLSAFGVEGTRTLDLAASAVLCVVSLGYGLWIWKKTE